VGCDRLHGGVVSKDFGARTRTIKDLATAQRIRTYSLNILNTQNSNTLSHQNVHYLKQRSTLKSIALQKDEHF